MPSADAPPMLAGYRVIRTLGVGSRATVYLGIPGELPPQTTADSSTVVTPHEPPRDAVPSPVAIKVMTVAPRESVGVEIRALESVARLPVSLTRHCVRLLDLATAEDGLPTLVLSRASRGSVAQLLHDRVSLETGEAVTVLAPMAQIIRGIHGAGVTHNALSATSVHFGSAGEPVLLGFGHAAVFPPNSSPADLEQLPGVAADHQRLALLAELVLCRVRDLDDNVGVRRLLEWIAASSTADLAFPGALEEKLFALAPAQPVEFARADRPGVPSRVGHAALAGMTPTRADAPAHRVFARSRAGVPLVARPLSSMGTALSAARTTLITALRRVRRPVWVLFAGVLAALVAALVLIPTDVHDSGADGGVAASIPPASVSSPAPGTTPHANGPASPSPGASPTGSADGSDAVRGDDPLAAVAVLLEARARCFNDLSVLCLDDVDHAGSSALTDDRAAIRAILAGGEMPTGALPGTTAPKLVERLGDSALVTVASGPRNTQPASILMIRTEAGWRLREFVTP